MTPHPTGMTQSELNDAVMATEDPVALREMLAAELARPGGARKSFVKRIKHRLSRVIYLETVRELEG
jgi:DNA topoisomerase VI subunit B